VSVDTLLAVKAIIMGIVEGLTEFLPISSTGHLIVTGQLLHFLDHDRRNVFTIVIQLGAILAVCWAYRQKIWAVASNLHTWPAQRFVVNLLVAFLPAALIGVSAIGNIKHYLFHPIPVATALIAGGFVILWAERRQHTVRVQEVDDMSWKEALKVGFAQSLALVPGVSRSGATIIGGLFFGLSRKAATEFSFFLAIPTMFAATAYDLYKHRDLLSSNDLGLFLCGFAAAFCAGFAAVRVLLRYVQNHDFTVFAYYRIGFGVLVLATAALGWIDWSAGG
jgi:undecaprenyl-diphosphatase